jgi:acyl-CoA reductase-like NAD-dependent aldehyde dehydrogenase
MIRSSAVHRGGSEDAAMSVVLCPIDGSVISEVDAMQEAQVSAAYDAAVAVMDDWRRTSAQERGRVLLRASAILHERAEEFGKIETLNTGKPLRDTSREAGRAAYAFEYYGGWADKVTGDTIPVPGQFHTYTRREPHGVAVGIIPWNVPYVFAAKKIAPALAFGNVSLLKPAEETPLTALMLRDVLAETGVPEGVVQVVTGGSLTGSALVNDPRADLIVFTGSDVTGKAIARAAASNLTPVALELGGKSPQVVFDDADLDTALSAVMLGIFGATGQMCIAGSRLLLHEDVYDTFMARLVERVQALRVGDPRVEGVQIGPQITSGQRDKTLMMIEGAIGEGARVAAAASLPTEPELEGGFFAPPTVFTEVSPSMTVMREEVFGPVLAVTRFRTEAEALDIAHQTDFGLAAGVWTSDMARAHRMAAELNVGTVWLNTYRVLSDQVPFGGVGLSGYGREGGNDAVGLYTRTKSVWTSLEPALPPGYGL